MNIMSVGVAAAFMATAAATGAEEEGGHLDEGGEYRIITYSTEHITDPILFFFFTLLLGALTQLVLVRLPPHWPKPPYTVLLFLMGIIMGALTVHDKLDTLSHSTNGMINMDPHLVLHAFLPPLLFESAFGMTHHVFLKVFPQAFLLAIPGVCIATGLTGILCKELFVGYDWHWTLAFMFGAMVSATDPVAVVGLLLELNAPKPLSTVIEAESLMNDGSAFVLFLVLMEFASGNMLSAGKVFDTSLRMALGGPALGLAFGIGFNELFLRFCINDPTIEISLTVVAAYLAFWTAESTDFKTSGVLTVVTLGVYMGGVGKHNISPEIHHYMHHVWAFLSHAANTVLFVLSGAFTYNLISDGLIEGRDWGYLFLLYVIVHVTRGATIAMLWPALKNLGYGLTVERGILLWYGGLRGSVGLVLALLVSHETGITRLNRVRIQFLVAGLVALTIGINGTSAGLLYAKLGLGESTKGHKATLKLSIDYVESNSDKLAQRMKKLSFWGKLVQEDLEKEVASLTMYRPHCTPEACKQGQLDGCTDIELVKREVVRWFSSRSENAGRIVSAVTYIEVISDEIMEAQFSHVPEAGGQWPPPIIANLKQHDEPVTCAYSFALENGRIIGHQPIARMHGNVYGVHGRTTKKEMEWYPDFSHIITKGKPSSLQRLFKKTIEHQEATAQPLLNNIREDIRRIIIVSVQHRYEEWQEKRIIRPDVYGILEEATLYVEDEDQLWVSKNEAHENASWEFRGRYDLKSEFTRILGAVGLCEHGVLSLAVQKDSFGRYGRSGRTAPDSEASTEHEDASVAKKYWKSRTDPLGKAMGMTASVLGGTDKFTYAYLHQKLRIAIHCLMFYKAAHEQAWNEIHNMWGALLRGDDTADRTMKEEEEDLNWCYRTADELLENIACDVPETRGLISALHEDFIHRLLVVQMTESTEQCLKHGMLTEGDSDKMLEVIRTKLKPFWGNHIVGEPAARVKHLVEKSLQQPYANCDEVLRLPNWKELEELMHEMTHESIINKKTYWEIKFVSRLQQLVLRAKHKNDPVEEEVIQFVTVNGEERPGSVDAGSGNLFSGLMLSKERTAHLSQMSTDLDDLPSDNWAIGDACGLKSKSHDVLKHMKDPRCLTRSWSPNLSPSLLKRLYAAERSGQSKKGWIAGFRNTGSPATEALVYCSLVEGSSDWYPLSALKRCPNFLYEDLMEKNKCAAKSRFLWAARLIWFRACVDRSRQYLRIKYPHVIPNFWLEAKMIQHGYVGTPWPWWGSVVQNDSIVFTEASLPDGSPDWSKECSGELLASKAMVKFVECAVVRRRETQEVISVKLDHWKKAEELILASHYGELGLLPSSSITPFVVGGTEYPTTDHYYQSCKYPYDCEEAADYRRRIIEAKTAAIATALGQDRNGPKIRKDWDVVRDGVMMRGIRAKFALCCGKKRPHEQLLSTGNKVLLCVEPDPDSYNCHWAMCANKEHKKKYDGENQYGKLLMLMRTEMRQVLATEPLVAAALVVVATQTCSRADNMFRVGEHVRVRDSKRADWTQGIVSSVSYETGAVTVLAEGFSEPSVWRYIQPYVIVGTFCPACGRFVRGVADTLQTCECGEALQMPRVAFIFGLRRQVLAPSAAVEPAMYSPNDPTEVFNSTDHYYQAMKFPKSALRTAIRNAPTSQQAVKLGQSRDAIPPMRVDWDSPTSEGDVPKCYLRAIKALDETLQTRTKVMIDAIRMKFSLHMGLFPRHFALLNTGDKYLLLEDREDNLSALYWGSGPSNTGLNMYGVLLMAARGELCKELSSVGLVALAATVALSCTVTTGWFSFLKLSSETPPIEPRTAPGPLSLDSPDNNQLPAPNGEAVPDQPNPVAPHEPISMSEMEKNLLDSRDIGAQSDAEGQ